MTFGLSSLFPSTHFPPSSCCVKFLPVVCSLLTAVLLVFSFHGRTVFLHRIQENSVSGSSFDHGTSGVRSARSTPSRPSKTTLTRPGESGLAALWLVSQISCLGIPERSKAIPHPLIRIRLKIGHQHVALSLDRRGHPQSFPKALYRTSRSRARHSSFPGTTSHIQPRAFPQVSILGAPDHFTVFSGRSDIEFSNSPAILNPGHPGKFQTRYRSRMTVNSELVRRRLQPAVTRTHLVPAHRYIGEIFDSGARISRLIAQGLGCAARRARTD
ncbi:hypothetical protein DFP72DRAFT_853258 [Ephemerocybe angulata]|uniref:Uncharacterized protein n=1 Tax=Ephemerocybe angulata TaxID=980116 RepID=A0A8H6M0B8_9AGAR|nr:hypothetical protein DFP72DRAFT_853258 [Tulosesus angulatus]